MPTKKRPSKKDYIVYLEFEVFEFNVVATSAGEAKKKALAKISRKKLTSLLDKKHTSVVRL